MSWLIGGSLGLTDEGGPEAEAFPRDTMFELNVSELESTDLSNLDL